MANGGDDIVFQIGGSVVGLTRAGQQGEKALAALEREAKVLERQIGKIGEAGVSFQKSLNQMTGVTRDLGKSAKDSAAAFEAFERSKAQVDALRASIDPLFAASKRYEQALQTLDAALEQGAISARQHAAMTDMVSASMLRADGASAAMGGRLGFLGGMSQQVRGQIQQAGFQIQDFAVQVGAGTSATQAFAQQFPQMAGAFGPWGVALGTAAAILVPLAGYFLTASENADKLSESMTEQQAVFDRLRESAERYRIEREMLASGAKSAEEQRAIEAVNEMLRQRAGIVADITLLEYDSQRAQSLSAAAERVALNDKLRALDAEIKKGQATIAYERAQRAASETQERATEIAERFRDLQQVIADADISGPWQNVLGRIQNAIDKAREYAQAMQISQTGGGRGQSPGGPLVGSADLAELQAGGGVWRPMPVEADGGGGGGGGGGANPMLAQVEQLRQQLMTEEQIEMESHAKRQEMLQQALDQKLLTQQEYAALMEQAQTDHSKKMSDIDVWRYGTGLEKASEFFGSMSSAMQGGNEKMLKISKAFGAAQALISAWQGAAEALKLPFPQNLAAFAKVLGTGLGAVKAIQGAKPGGTTSGGGGASGGAAVAQQQPVQTLNLSFTNDPWGIRESFARQLIGQMNTASRNGMLINANVVG